MNQKYLKSILNSLFIVLSMGYILVLTSCSPTIGGGVRLVPKTKNYVVPLKNILDQIKSQYTLAQEWLTTPGPDGKTEMPIELTEADVSFDATNNLIIDGNLSVFVAKADFKTTINGESTVTFKIAKDPPAGGSGAKMLDATQNKLAHAIYNAAKTFNSINGTYIDQTKAQSFEVDITYSITFDGNISVGITGTPVGGGGSVESSHQTKHTIKLFFDRKH